MGYNGDKNTVIDIEIPFKMNNLPVNWIGPRAFCNLDSLVSVNIPDGVEFIGKEAFRECTALKSVQFPIIINEIGDSAFCGCESLTSINFPGYVMSIGENAFADCNALTSAIFEGDPPENFGKNVFHQTPPDFKIYYKDNHSGVVKSDMELIYDRIIAIV